MADQRIVILVETDDEGMFRFVIPPQDIGSCGYGVILAEIARGVSKMIAETGGHEEKAVLDSIIKAMISEAAFPMAAEESAPARTH